MAESQQQVGPGGGQQVVPAAARPTPPARRPAPAPPPGPSAMATATARFSSTTGDGHEPDELAVQRGDLRASRCPAASAAVAWQAAMAACTWYGPAGRAAGRRPGWPTPSSISAASQRDRSWSSSGTRSPAASTRAGAPGVMEAASARAGRAASGSSGMSWLSARASRMASAHRPWRTRSAPGAGRVALVEQQVQHGEHAAGPLRQQVRGRHPVGDAPRRGSCAWPGPGAWPWSAPGPGTPGRSPRWSARPACAASARPGPPAPAPGGSR